MYVFELAGEDDAFAALEAGSAATGVQVVAPGLATAESVDLDRVPGLAFTHRASRLLGRTRASIESGASLLRGSRIDREGSVAVRARDVRATAGVDTSEAEHVLGSVLTERGFAVDLEFPDHELRALFSDGRCILGWLAVEAERGFGARSPTEKPFFQPGSMDPQLARALCNLAGAGPETTLLDPMCGTGGILVEAGLLGARVVGIDAQRAMVHGACTNLEQYLDRGFAVCRGDATQLPICDGGVDAIVFDAPYGRQSRIAGGDLEALVSGALHEARRVTDRAVFGGDRSWVGEAGDAGWTVEASFERRTHRSLTRHGLVLGADS